MRIRGFRSHHTEDVDQFECVAVELTAEFLPQSPVRDQDVCALQSGQIERLARRGAGNTVLPEFLAQGGKRDVTFCSVQNKIFMNLVGND
ncbi:hypothetical protein D3C80_1366630 [compost metagenome]